jgi:uncharacterized protein (DUF433 family)
LGDEGRRFVSYQEDSMSLLEMLVAEPPPLRLDEGGVFRVGATRVRLDTVITAFQNGCSAEEIQRKYPSLGLDDTYAVLTYYFWNRERVDAYLEERRRLAEEVRQEIEARDPSEGTLERLLERRAARG